MYQKRFVLCAAAALLAVAIACSKSSSTPVSPGTTENVSGEAAADGSTLKATAPSPTSPVNGAQPESLVLTANRGTAKFTTTLLAHEFQIRTSGGTVVAACTSTVPAGSGGTVSYTPTCSLEFDQPHTWRVRAVHNSAFGPWSPDAAFRTASGGYVRGNEVFDPLTNGKTVGSVVGPIQFVPGVGMTLESPFTYVTYRLPENLQEGEFSMMVRGADEGNPGDKAKIFCMQEGDDVSDITDDDYRMTAELRGRDYGAPGSVAFRIIPGDGNPRDGERHQVNFDSTRWYFWRFSWVTGRARLEVRRDNETGPAVYDLTVGTGSHPYRPSPHLLHLGSPIGRNGPIDATHPGMTIKNVWASSRPRPIFAQ